MKIKVSLIQDAPVFFDKAATIEKMESIIASEASKGTNLIVFPESYIPGYPRGFSFGAVVGSRSDEGRKLYSKYQSESISIDSIEMNRIIQLSKEHNTYLVFGFSESRSDNGSIYCSMAYVSPSHGLLGVHRKIKPTGSERIIWAEAGAESLVTCDTKIGKLGGLICWENYMPMARLSMYQKGVEIYIAPTADSRENWTSTLKHIALEGRCFVLGCNQYFTKSMYPDEYQHLVKDEKEELSAGGSVIISPMGEVINGPLFGEAGVLSAEIDLEDVVKSKLDFDTNGHYTRPDIFTLSINGQPDTIKEDQ